MSLGNSIRAAGITGQVISIEPSGRVCLLSSPLQNLPFYCLEKRWDKGTWKMWTTVYRLGKYVATNYRSRLPTPQDWLKQTRFICLTESEVGCPELVQVLRGLRDWASFYIFFLHRSSLDLLSILSTLWSQISCCSSNCCNFISTGRVSRSQEKKKKKSAFFGGVLSFVLEGTALLGYPPYLFGYPASPHPTTHNPSPTCERLRHGEFCFPTL